jgi:hypothetical protein
LIGNITDVTSLQVRGRPKLIELLHELVPQTTKAVIGGFVIIDVSSREAALEWAAKFAAACRCAQEVREIMFDPFV